MQTVAHGRLSRMRLVAHSFKLNRLQRLPIPWLLLLLSLIVTGFVWQQEQQLLQTRIQTRLRQEVAYTDQALENQLAYSQEALYSARSFLVANDGVTLAMWQRYVESLDLSARYPGLVELGYVAYVPEADLPGFVETLRQSTGGVAPQVAVGQPDYLITQFLYAQGVEQLMVGQDLGADFALRSVAERARDLDEVVISRKVQLAGMETAVNPVEQAGVFLFLPVYGKETAVQGWVYATVSTQALLEGTLGLQDSGLHVELYDGTAIEPETILFDHSRLHTHTLEDMTFRETQLVNLNGRVWTLSFSTLPAFNLSIDESQPTMVLITGIIFSFFIFGLTWTVFTARERALILAEAMTSTLRENEERYRTLVENAPEAIVVLDVNESLIEDVNENAVHLFGLSRKHLLRTSLAALSPASQPDGQPSLPLMADKLAQALSGHRVEFEWVYLNAHGDEILCDVRFVRLPSKSRNLVRGSITDITERERTKKAMEQAQKLESLGVLAGGVAHDFNNLLVAMLGHTSLAMMRLPASNPAYDHIAQAVKAAERAADLTQQMLAYSGRGHFRMQPIDLNTLLDENLHLFTSAIPKNITLQKQLAHGLPRVDADLGQMQQVVMNLILNGADAIGQKQGMVKITTMLYDLESGDKEFSQLNYTLKPGRYIRLDVTDNGCGMDEQTVSRIFDPFFTTKQTGRGLGLAAVQGIVRGHKGGLHVSSKPGEGTTFSLMLPVSKSELDAVMQPPALQDVAIPADCLVLVIDDEASVRNIVTDILEMDGIRTMVAPNGEIGIELYEKYQDDIDLVLLDLSMPGLNGHETFIRLQRINPRVNVVLSSGYDESDATVQFVGHGLSGFIQKPYEPGYFLTTIKGYLANVTHEVPQYEMEIALV
ncbi:MAG: CHASE domain-containing protein [Chloroflexota bacterium]